MKRFFALILLVPVVCFANPILPSSSQARHPNESFQDAVNRHREVLNKRHLPSLLAADSPIGKKVPFSNLDYSSVVKVQTHEELIHLFNVIRDTRFLLTNNHPGFERRISWLYPDDGCFARAALAGMRLNEEELVRPSKVFAFGNLDVTTPYSPSGHVSWWYHVAPIVTFNGDTYVLDPALDPLAPMRVEDWFSKMGNTSSLKGAVCNPYSYAPFDSCEQATINSDGSALGDELYYLDREWERVSSLGFDPYFLLGKNPPWVFDAPQVQ